MKTTTLPCGECGQRAQDLRDAGNLVHGCTPHPSVAGACVLRYERAPDDAPRAMPAAQPKSAPLTPDGALSPRQVQAAQAIVNVFETSAARGRYGLVTVIPGDTGHLSYGRAQLTLGSGNLAALLADYLQRPGAVWAQRLAPFLPRLQARDFALDTDERFHNLLRAASDDPLMRAAQDEAFDLGFWQPALRAAQRQGLRTALGAALAYDGRVHGSWGSLARQVDAVTGDVAGVGEAVWLRAYVAARKAWLAGHARADLRATVYRMEAFERLLAQQRWNLALPFVVQGVEVSEAALDAPPPGSFDGPAPGTRALALSTPMARGLDVRLLQLHLSDSGLAVRADGVFGTGLQTALQARQRARGRPANGTVTAAEAKRAAQAALTAA